VRIAIATWSQRVTGGIETYLDQLLPALRGEGHDVALCCEVDAPADRARITTPPGSPVWQIGETGPEPALAAMRDWRPDVIYTHGLHQPELERRLPGIAPVVFFAHAYHGTCVGGAKTFKAPVIQPCARVFGAACLAQYYPRRCGGLNPVTMWRQFTQQSARLENLRSVHTILVHSEHMADEYRRHGLRDKTRKVIFPVEPPLSPAPAARKTAGDGSRLLFLGRCETTKGGAVLIESLPEVAAALQRPLQITVAGEGSERSAWEEQARRVTATHPGIQFTFTGWVDQRQREELFAQHDLLVVPSLWPEPFGLAGLEAGHFGVPVAAFRVGGIPEWLRDGENGHLAPGDPPTAAGLAAAIIKCLNSEAERLRLGQGAANIARRFSLAAHLADLLAALRAAAKPV
jgi:glycosyltransferase involved in cell wall biosynthesis